MASVISNVELKAIGERVKRISISLLGKPLEVNIIDDDHTDPVIEIDASVAMLPFHNPQSNTTNWDLAIPVNRESTLTDYDEVCTYKTLDECITQAFGLWAETQVKIYFDKEREEQFVQSQEDKYES